MSGKSKKSAATIDRPFAAKLSAEARRVVESYQVIVSFEDGEWYGRGLELPHIMADGKTVEECVANTREALLGAVALLLEEGERPPAPAREAKRTRQVNVRLTDEEKLLLEAAAKRKGFSGLSDFIRAAAVEAVR